MINSQSNISLSVKTPKGGSWTFGIIGFLAGAIIFFFLGQIYNRPVSVESPFEKTRLGVIGKVVAVGNGILEIEADSSVFGLAPVRYTAIVDGGTVIKKSFFAKGELKFFETKPGKTVNIVLSDVKNGDQVAAKSAVNFWGKNEFSASEVEVRVFQ